MNGNIRPIQKEPIVGIAFDPGTLAKAVHCLTQATGSGAFEPASQTALRFEDWYSVYDTQVASLSSIEGMASSSHDELNAFLNARGFKPLFRPFAGMGAVGTYRLNSPWQGEAEAKTMTIHGRTIKAFQVDRQGVDYYQVPALRGHSSTLARLGTQDGGAIWIIMTDTSPSDDMYLAEMANYMMLRKKPWNSYSMSILMPRVEISQVNSLDWMVGTCVGDMSIDQAFQAIDLQLSEEGAKIKAASGVIAKGAPRLHVVSSPFVGWRTEPGSDVPIAAFHSPEEDWIAA